MYNPINEVWDEIITDADYGILPEERDILELREQFRSYDYGEEFRKALSAHTTQGSTN